MAKMVKCFEVWSEYFDFDNNNRVHKTSVTISNQNIVFQSLMNAIDQNNSIEFKNLLNSDFIYSCDGNDYPPYISKYTGNRHTETRGYEYYLVRPVIETLFYEHTLFFRSLVSKVVQSGNIVIHSDFLDSFKEKDIPSDMFTPWSALQSFNILNAINAISVYGKKFPSDEQQIIRSKHAQELANLLTENLKNSPPLDNSSSSLVQWLDFKFKFLKALHSKDAHFIGHLGWKRVVANLASLVFSAGILNLLNLAFTGNFLFFNQTATQNMVSTLDAYVEIEQCGDELNTEAFSVI